MDLEIRPSSPAAARLSTELAPELSWLDGFALVVGNVIGSGIFLASAFIANQLPSRWGALFVWLTGGILSMFGALSLGELGALYPRAGGLYVYLAHAFGRPIAFVYGWCLLAVIHTGTIATLATGFGLYLSQVVPLTAPEQKIAGIAAILVLTAVSATGVRRGKSVQNLTTVVKVGGLLLLAIFLLVNGDPHRLSPTPLPSIPTRSEILHFGVALIAVLWAYEGWHVVSFTAGEFRAPTRDLPQSLLWGTIACALIYVIVNAGYYSALPISVLSASPSAATAAVDRLFGERATTFVSVLILTSIFGGMNGMILTGPRVYYAMARDGLFFPCFAAVSEGTRVPTVSIIVQGVWACLLSLAANFNELFTYVVSTAWIFYGLTVAGVVVLRIREPRLLRPYRVPGYPWIPILFSFAALAITVNAAVSDFKHWAAGTAAILTAVPAYYFFRDRREARVPNGRSSSP